MPRCKHRSTHEEPQPPMKIGPELVTYVDIVCNDCDQLIARRITNREKSDDD